MDEPNYAVPGGLQFADFPAEYYEYTDFSSDMLGEVAS